MKKQLTSLVIVLLAAGSLGAGWLIHITITPPLAVTLMFVIMLFACLVSANCLVVMTGEKRKIITILGDIQNYFNYFDEQTQSLQDAIKSEREEIKILTEAAIQPVLREMEMLISKDEDHDKAIARIDATLIDATLIKEVEPSDEEQTLTSDSPDDIAEPNDSTPVLPIKEESIDASTSFIASRSGQDGDFANSKSPTVATGGAPTLQFDAKTKVYPAVRSADLDGESYSDEFEKFSVAIANGNYSMFMQPLVALNNNMARSSLYDLDIRVKGQQERSVTQFIDFWRDTIFGQIDAMMIERAILMFKHLYHRDKSMRLIVPVSRHFLAIGASFEDGSKKFKSLKKNYSECVTSIIIRLFKCDYATLNSDERARLAILRSLGFRFCFDQSLNLYFDPSRLAREGACFVRIPLTLLTARGHDAGDIHPKDVGQMLRRFDIETIVEGVTNALAGEKAIDFGIDWGIGGHLAGGRVIPEALFSKPLSQHQRVAG